MGAEGRTARRSSGGGMDTAGAEEKAVKRSGGRVRGSDDGHESEVSMRGPWQR